MGSVGHVTVPGGFLAAGVRCGVKQKDQEDLAILAAGRDVPTAVLTTRNQVIGAPVAWCRKILPRGYGRTRGIVINSGCSNVCTGKAGQRDAEGMARLTAERLGTSAEKVLVASTGIIGHRLPMEKIRRGIDDASGRLSRRDDAAVARAIMTTDTREKSAVVQFRMGSATCTVAGVAKGSGMIAPSLATMISVLTTDAPVTPPALHRALCAAADPSFNAVTIDTDTSTSDTVAAFASGAIGGRTLGLRSTGFRKFSDALDEVCLELARALAADGEGATRLVEVRVRGAAAEAHAKAAAKSVAGSPLVRTAVHGADPNWGRIVMALGKSEARIDPLHLTIRIGGTLVFARGRPRAFDEAAVSRHLRQDRVEIDCNLGLGRDQYTAFTCDLTREYISINADYST